MRIRPASPEDFAAVLALWEHARARIAVTADNVEALERLLGRDLESLLVAEAAGEIVGALIAAWDGWRGNLYRLAVAAEHRRGGVGRALVEAGEARLRGLGATRVTALVGRDDEGVAAFWDAVGYPLDVPVGRRVRNLPAEPRG